MREQFHDKKIYQADPSTYGGMVYSSDFNTNYRGKANEKGSAIAARILSDQRFDMQCRKNSEERERGAFTSADLGSR